MTPAITDAKAGLAFIRWAQGFLQSRIHRTPLLECRSLSRLAGVALRIKCENLQRGGSFKIRGALTRAFALSERDRARGLITYSSGNHGQAVALAASIVGTRAVVVLPEDAVPSKVAAAAGYGAEVVLAGTTSEDRKVKAESIAGERDLVMVPPFDDPYVVAGQGTVGLEVMEEWPDARVVYVPIGGGGLLSGTALAVKAMGLGTRIVGVEPAGAARATASLAAGAIVRLERTSTIADGLRPLALGALNFDLIRRHVDEVITVSDEEIVAALRLLLERAKLVAEPSGAVAVAGALRHARSAGGPAVAVLSGGNINFEPLLGSLFAERPPGVGS